MWFENSVLYEMFQNRIQIDEFLSLLSSDSEWTYFATHSQVHKVLELFDKVYGFWEGMSRLKQQQMLHKKRVSKVEKRIDAGKYKKKKKDTDEVLPVVTGGKKPAKETKILNELYDTNVYTSREMIDRYTDYLYIVLKSRWDPFIRSKYDIWQKHEKGFVN